MAKRMYMGTREYMTWVKCPAIDAGISRVGWQAVSQYLNGGANVRRSSTGHKEYNFVWPMANTEDANIIKSFASNVYGNELIYFLDPFAVRTNVLPHYWSTPRLAWDDAPSLVYERRPTLVGTAVNSLGYPTKSAVYELRENDTFASLYIPIPPGHTFHLGVHGSSTGSATILVTPDGASDGAVFIEDPPGSGLYLVPDGWVESSAGLYAVSSGMTEEELGLYSTMGEVFIVSPMAVTDSNRTDLAINNTTGVTITLSGVGYLTLAGLIGQVLPDGLLPDKGGFLNGEGHSGCRFDGFPDVVGYSSPQALDKQSITARLIEVGAWE